jgi:hypothetical protein
LPGTASELNSTAAQLQWVISIGRLALGAFMMCAVAPSATVPIVFRLVQVPVRH